MKKFIPFLFTIAISIVAILSSLTYGEPELGISTAILTWTGCLWIVSGKKEFESCFS